jgi:hypothetical protein
METQPQYERGWQRWSAIVRTGEPSQSRGEDKTSHNEAKYPRHHEGRTGREQPPFICMLRWTMKLQVE